MNDIAPPADLDAEQLAKLGLEWVDYRTLQPGERYTTSPTKPVRTITKVEHMTSGASMIHHDTDDMPPGSTDRFTLHTPSVPAYRVTGPGRCDLEFDLAVRWAPSPEQDAAAAEALTLREALALRGDVEVPDEREVFTIQLLVGKKRSVWTRDVTVVALPGVYLSRAEALAACKAAADTHRALRPDVPVTGSWAVHWELATAAAPSRTRDHRTWQTFFSMFEEV
jgi:hypothetical protein